MTRCLHLSRIDDSGTPLLYRRWNSLLLFAEGTAPYSALTQTPLLCHRNHAPPPPLFWLTLARQYSTVKLALCLTRLADPQPCPINRLPRTAGVPGFRCLTLIGSIILTLNCRCQRLDLYFDPYVCLYQPFVLNFSFPTEVFTIKCEALFVLVYNRN